MISVHIVSYNNAKHTINAVDSALRNSNIEVQVLVLENGSNQQEIETFLKWKSLIKDPRIRYFHGIGNLGFSGGVNFLAAARSPEATHIVEMNNDMIFGTYSLGRMFSVLELNPTIGVVCATLTNGGLYDRAYPTLAHVGDFLIRTNQPMADKTIPIGGSNVPWMMSVDFFEQLRLVDVFDPPLPFNKYPGVWDESIDPKLAAWCADWDVHNRILHTGKQVAVLPGAKVYHYEHCSIDSLGDSSWQQFAVANYVLKYGPRGNMNQFGMESKGLPMIKKSIPSGYPVCP